MVAFREMEERDTKRVVELWEACGLTRPWNDPYLDISFALDGKASTILVGEREHTIVASVMVGHDGHRGILYYVAVDPVLQKQGIGKQTVREAEAWLESHGVWKVNLLVRAENEAARGFYEALGYEVNPVLCMARRIGSGQPSQSSES
jgi:ribosomal protein S18 acetylase RimI-like enzyme